MTYSKMEQLTQIKRLIAGSRREKLTKWRVNRSRYCIIGEITRLFFFSKYLVLYFTHHFEKYVFYRNFEKYNAYVLLILGVTSRIMMSSGPFNFIQSELLIDIKLNGADFWRTNCQNVN